MCSCDKTLSRIKDVLVIVLLLMGILAAAVVISGIHSVSDATTRTVQEFSTLPGRIQDELAQTNTTIDKANVQWLELADRVSLRTTNQLTSEIRESRIEALATFDSRLGGLIDVTAQEIRESREMLDVHLALANRDLTQVATTLDAFHADTQPIMANAEWWTRRDTVAPQVLGVLGATKVTMGNVAKMSRTVEAAVPAYVQSTQGIAKSLDERLKPKWYDRILSATATGALIWSTTK